MIPVVQRTSVTTAAFLVSRLAEWVLRCRRGQHRGEQEQYDGLSNTLEVHVMELRKKLEAHGPRIIHTIRGRGYMLGDPVPPEGA
jgi:DNA-binding response OmpR family regulator